MATLPPPYTQRDAARAQRYYRCSMRRPSLLGPVVLVVVGVLALLVETNRLNVFHLWDWYLRWWPLLLIGVGLLSLGEWWLDRSRPTCRLCPPFPRWSDRADRLPGHLWLRGRQHRPRAARHPCIRARRGAGRFLLSLLGQEHNDDRNLNQADSCWARPSTSRYRTAM